MIVIMDMECAFIQLEPNMRVIGKKEKRMEKKSAGGRMVIFTKV